MAWRLSTVDPATGGSRALDLLLSDSRLVHTLEGRDLASAPPAMEIPHSVGARQGPWAEAGTSPQGNPPMEYNSMQQSWSCFSPPLDPFTVQNSRNLLVTEHDGFRVARVQDYGEQELHSGIPDPYNASENGYHRIAGTSVLGNDRQGEVLTYPEGEADAVTITERDMEGLRPAEYLSDNIIDFYIKYLGRRLPSEARERCHFFNSFFFAKVFGMNWTSNDVNQCKIDHEQMRKWSAGVNLFEKDFVFIPVVRRSHWSLIIICHLRSLWSACDERRGSPCILHLDSFGGIHESFKRQVRRFLSTTWMVKRHASDNMDQVLDLCQMKYIKAEVPQQKNRYDCGVYLLHYIEVFLSQPSTLRFAPRKGVQLFTRPDFSKEVSAKRMAIGKLILELKGEYLSCGHAVLKEVGSMDACGGRIADVQSNSVSLFNPHAENRSSWELTLDIKPGTGGKVAHGEDEPIEEVPVGRSQQVRKRASAALPGPSKVCKKRIWDKEETSILLNCKAEGGRFCKENGTGMDWNNIAEEITNRVGTSNRLGLTTPSAEQCRRRYETLHKAYKSIKDYVVVTGRTFSEITEEEKRKLKLATELTEAQYKLMDSFSHKVKSHKRAKHSGSDGTCQVPPCGLNNAAPVPPPVPAGAVISAPILAPALIPSGSSTPSKKQVAIPGFRDLREELRATLLNLIQGLVKHHWYPELEEVCWKLAIVQDRNLSDIRDHMFQLSALKLVNVEYDFEVPEVKLPDLLVYRKFVEKVLRKNPDFDIYLPACDKDGIVSFPEASVLLSVQRIRVVKLYWCRDLQHVDLSLFPELRVLEISGCFKLEKVTGWEVVRELGYLHIWGCTSLEDFPPIQRLPSLREFRVEENGRRINSVPDFSQCVRLRSLEIWSYTESWALNSMDLSTLRFLEVLDFYDCGALTTIQGLSGLLSLTTLNLAECTALKRVPELGCLKGLTKLDMSESGVEEISGVEELHLLTSLDFTRCSSLKTLPCLGHLKVLTELDIIGSGVEEIPGVQDLARLEILRCKGSRLKSLPDLHHLPQLRSVSIDDTPLSTTISSSFYYGKGLLTFNPQRHRKDFDDDISDVSDTESF